MAERRTEILVIGGGPAGLAAANAASSRGKRVTIIDENPDFGGQIWRAEKRELSSMSKELIDSLEKNGVEMIPSSTCAASLPDQKILALSQGITFPVAYEKIIIATGARERFLPFPGWTLAGVFGAGGLQALVKGGFDVAGKRIVIAGTGPLLLAVAAYLRRKGGDVLFVAEQAPLRSLARLGIAALRIKGKVSEAINLKRNLQGVSYRTSSIITRAAGDNALREISIRRHGKESTVKCDLLAIGYHLVPNTEVAGMLGCAVTKGAVLTDEFERTTVEDVFCAGEPTGIGGLDLSLIEGKIAGLAAAGILEEAELLFADALKHRTFASEMERAFRLKPEYLRGIATDDTIVCRCEDVRFGDVKDFGSFRDAKLQTRLGMGYCQGRVCGPACGALFGWDENNSVRPPIVPVTIGELAKFGNTGD